MSYTQTDLENIQRAILDLATGERVTEIRVDGILTRYAEADLPALKQLRSEIQASLTQTNLLGKQYRLIQTSKGL